MAGITKGLSFIFIANIISNRYFSNCLNRDAFIRNKSIFVLLSTTSSEKNLCMGNMSATDTDMVAILKKIQLHKGMYNA